MRSSDSLKPYSLGYVPEAWLVLASLIVILSQTFMRLQADIWPQEQYSYGPLIPLIFCYLAFVKRRDWLRTDQTDARPLIGLMIVIFSLCALFLGRRASVVALETAAIAPIVLGLVIAIYGISSARALRFPILFLLLTIPLPGIVMYTLTSQLKLLNAIWVVDLLYLWGFPVALDGVIITIGPYKLFLADACAGIHSLFALGILGSVAIYLAPNRSTRRKIVLCGLLLPLALLSNFLRVLALLLITYEFNDAIAEQVHETIGYISFLISLGLLLYIDQKVQQHKESRRAIQS